MNPKNFLFCVLTLGLFAAPALSSDAVVWPRSDAIIWPLSMISGSEKLAYYSLVKARPKGSEQYLENFMKLDGLAHRKGEPPKKLMTEYTIGPLVGYDNNLNNGIPKSKFSVGDLLFVVDQDSVAKKGITLGVAASAYSRFSIAPKQIATFKVAASYEYAPEHNLDKITINANTCWQAHIARWTWINSCGGYRHLRKKYETGEKFLSTRGSQMFSSAIGHHEASIALERGFREDYSKSKVAFSLLSAVRGVGVIRTGIRWGEHIHQRHTTLNAATFAFTRPIYGKTTSVLLNYSRAGGSSHFGQPRTDDTYTIMLRRPVNERIIASFGYQVTNSNIDLYQDNQILFAINLKSWRF
ncbi:MULTISPECIES: hypothetical protein [Halocynthiibacter]|uniref:DUF2219 family protein n=1 Tax=Halocynthiibacter halioticoli TaxID=2986804 RepID=A0AAE3J3V0_9RHOB|nr:MULTISPECIES: hypothetical protein [Halocynthiibacter]MCV6825137.1 hypothetical protein [Halocynthiibacter halioticoli]MCW4058138.1 hypothetical protein [Halocynthiibacter sp. SDUM655004]